MAKSLDSEVLSALHILSQNKVEGVSYIEFVKRGSMCGALDLIDRGYARKISVGGDDDANYCLTQNGIEYFDKVMKFASEQF